MDTHCLVIGQRYVLSQTAVYSSQMVQNLLVLGYAIITAPAQPHATKIAVYTALFHLMRLLKLFSKASYNAYLSEKWKKSTKKCLNFNLRFWKCH